MNYGSRVLVLAIVGVVLAILVACGDGGDATPTPTAEPSPTARPTPGGDTTVTVTPPPPPSEHRLVLSEYGNEADTIWLVNPVDPADRTEVVTIPHRPTFGINPSLSPDGRLLAYISQPESAPPDPNLSHGEAFILDLLTGETEMIAEGIDLRFTPLWAPDGRLLYMRRLSGVDPFSADVIIVRVEIPAPLAPGETATPSPTPSPSPTPPTPTPPTPTPFNPVMEILNESVSRVLSFVPIGFAGDEEGSLLFVQIAGGTGGQSLLGSFAPATTESIATATAFIDATATAVSELSPTPSPSPPPSGAPTPSPSPSPTPAARLVVSLSDQQVRAFDLSADAMRFSFLAPMLVEGDVIERAFIANLQDRSVAPLPPEGLPDTSHLNPVWHPDGQRLSVGFERSSGSSGAVGLVPVTGGALEFLPAPVEGYDEPLSWSPEGGFLATLHHAEGGQGRLDLVSPTGQRSTVLETPDFRLMGWYAPEQVPIPPPPPAGE